MPILIPASTIETDPSCSQLIDEVINSLQGFVRNSEQVTNLNLDIDDQVTLFTVDDATQVSPGLVEIDDELVWVQQVNTETSEVTLQGWGRGYAGSPATEHSTNTKVTNSPLFPRIRVAEALNSILASLAGKLWVPATADFSYTGAQTTYDLTSTATQVLAVHQHTLGPSQMWAPVTNYRVNPYHQTGGGLTPSTSIDITTALVPGQTVRVTYLREPVLFESTDTLLSATGLSPSARDLLIYGACWRLCAFIDSARLDVQSAMADNQDQPTPVGTAMNLSKYFYQMFNQRVSDELQRLQSRYPVSAYNSF